MYKHIRIIQKGFMNHKEPIFVPVNHKHNIL